MEKQFLVCHVFFIRFCNGECKSGFFFLGCKETINYMTDLLCKTFCYVNRFTR